MLLKLYATERAIAESLLELDFLHGMETYKMHWVSAVRRDWGVRGGRPPPAWSDGLVANEGLRRACPLAGQDRAVVAKKQT